MELFEQVAWQERNYAVLGGLDGVVGEADRGVGPVRVVDENESGIFVGYLLLGAVAVGIGASRGEADRGFS